MRDDWLDCATRPHDDGQGGPLLREVSPTYGEVLYLERLNELNDLAATT
ncbi:MAG: hypothetical protein KAU50_06725 [Candidatus Marinimicrobia bacterium]|nr:hypothetical protein [Candidatus Neomarinimicrobiota bacterium]